MCGRYALGIRAAYVRYQLQQQGLPVDDAPEDNEARETYNFPPGSFGLVYRAVVPDSGQQSNNEESEPAGQDNVEENPSAQESDGQIQPSSCNYELKVMKWGLIPFWTKRAPDYGSMMRTINCRDDSLIEDRGMWTTMKQRKRCIVVAQGFYEWLKKGPGGKEKIPHFVKRKDGNLMCFAGLWDCVKYEDSEEKLYTYSIITTDANDQLRFLHDRMPVVLDPKSDAMKLWLDPMQNKWSCELQSILKPYGGELECYPVNKDVGKVGNNSSDFILPIDSKDNKKNIVNFFDNAAKKNNEAKVAQKETGEVNAKDMGNDESNAPMPSPKAGENGLKRKHEDDDHSESAKVRKQLKSPVKSKASVQTDSTKRTRNATSNEGTTLKTSPSKKTEKGSQKITSFFVK